MEAWFGPVDGLQDGLQGSMLERKKEAPKMGMHLARRGTNSNRDLEAAQVVGRARGLCWHGDARVWAASYHMLHRALLILFLFFGVSVYFFFRMCVRTCVLSAFANSTVRLR